MKTNKSYTKRIKVTKNGKLKTRKIGSKGHLNAKQNNATKMVRKKTSTITIKAKKMSRVLPRVKTAPKKTGAKNS